MAGRAQCSLKSLPSHVSKRHVLNDTHSTAPAPRAKRRNMYMVTYFVYTISCRLTTLLVYMNMFSREPGDLEDADVSYRRVISRATGAAFCSSNTIRSHSVHRAAAPTCRPPPPPCVLYLTPLHSVCFKEVICTSLLGLRLPTAKDI